jgi:hypothetical protein
MISPNILEEIWGRLRKTFEQIEIQIKSSIPNLVLTTRHHKNPAFPFWAYGTYDNNSKSIDVSVDFKLEGQFLLISADIAREEGFVLADSQTFKVNLQKSEEELISELEMAITHIELFINAQTGLICDELS